MSRREHTGTAKCGEHIRDLMRPAGKRPLRAACSFDAIGWKALLFDDDPSERNENNYLIICSMYPITKFIILKTQIGEKLPITR